MNDITTALQIHLTASRQRQLNKSTAYIINGMRRERDVKEHNNEARYAMRRNVALQPILPSITEVMVAMRIQFLFNKPFTSLPLRSFFPSISMTDRHTGYTESRVNLARLAIFLSVVQSRSAGGEWCEAAVGRGMHVICCCFCLCQSLSALLITSDRSFIATWPLIYCHFVSYDYTWDIKNIRI